MRRGYQKGSLKVHEEIGLHSGGKTVIEETES